MPQDGGSSPVRFGHGARQIELGNGCGCRIKRTHPIKEKPESRAGTSDDVASRQSALRRWAEHVEHIRQGNQCTVRTRNRQIPIISSAQSKHATAANK